MRPTQGSANDARGPGNGGWLVLEPSLLGEDSPESHLYLALQAFPQFQRSPIAQDPLPGLKVLSPSSQNLSHFYRNDVSEMSIQPIEKQQRSGDPSDSGDSSKRKMKNKEIEDHDLIGDWEVISKIGQGSLGNVYKAKDIKSALQVALKKAIYVEENDDLLEEAEMMRRLDHPHIVKLIGVHKDDISKEVVIAMDFVPTGSLHYILVLQKIFSLSEAWRVMKQMASAFAYMHKKNIVHRNIKLCNVLCNYLWFVKVTDFGLAKLCTPGEKLDPDCGTLTYLAPEFFNMEKYEGPPADVWALGILSTQLFVGRKFNGHDLFQLDVSNNSVYKPPPCADKLLTSLLTVMLRENPKKRLTMKEISKHAWFKQKISIYDW
uniref:probable serine/threonine-protein kinase MARK-C n=1 Tax=Myxine glutinosa TaxID=7769 RepID=UPI00358F4C5E